MQKEQYFRNKVKQFYLYKGRNFFWRKKKLTPYQFMIIELFLKKTRAETVDKKAYEFVKLYNKNNKILREPTDEIFKQVVIFGLGKQRTKALKEISRYLDKNHNNKLPENIKELENIPFIGIYSSNAILCFGFNKRVPILDVNTSRIISRFFSIKLTSDLRNNRHLQDKAKDIIPRKGFKEYNWGLLDFGAIICKSRPLCDICPLNRKCDSFNSKKLRKA